MGAAWSDGGNMRCDGCSRGWKSKYGEQRADAQVLFLILNLWSEDSIGILSSPFEIVVLKDFIPLLSPPPFPSEFPYADRNSITGRRDVRTG